MGNSSTVFGHRKPTKILILGLDASGKTTCLNAMKLGQRLREIPTIGYNYEKIKYKNREYQIWDIGGQYELRQHWRYYYKNTRGLIMVLDANDKERMDEAKQEFLRIITHADLVKVPILIYANKQDFQHAMKASEIEESLGLKELRRRKWHVQPSSALAGFGILEGLNWLSKNM